MSLSNTFDNNLATAIKQIHTTGCQAAVRYNDMLAWQQEAGFDHKPANCPLALHSKFLIYSITKIFIAVLVLKLVERGLFSLNDKISQFFPDLSASTVATIEQILRHRSGLPDYSGSPEHTACLTQYPGDPWTVEQFFAYLKNNIVEQPNPGFFYSNLGYMLLHQLVEKASGKPFNDLLKTELIEPLKLTETFLASRISDLALLVPGYSHKLSKDRQSIDIRAVYHPGWVSHGTLASTATDTTFFLSCLFKGDLLKPESLSAMCQSLPTGSYYHMFSEAGYGLGLMTGMHKTHGRFFGHTGNGPGYGTAAYYLPDYANGPITIAVFCNCEPAAKAERILLQLLNC